MFNYLTDEEVETLELVAPVPAELAPPIESLDSIELGWPWKLGAIALLIAGFATIGFMLYA